MRSVLDTLGRSGDCISFRFLPVQAYALRTVRHFASCTGLAGGEGGERREEVPGGPRGRPDQGGGLEVVRAAEGSMDAGEGLLRE